MLNTAMEYEALGLHPIPCDVQKDSCNVHVKWRTDPQPVKGWSTQFLKQKGIGIILGKASKNLMVIDVDQKHDHTATISNRFLEGLKYMLPNHWDDFYIERTRSGGLHVFFYLQGEIRGKCVPAKTLDKNKDGKFQEFALIEVLGEGQMVFTAPTPNYHILQGSVEEIPTLDESSLEELLNVCRSFNEIPESVIEEKPDHQLDPNDQRPGSLYNAKIDPHLFAQQLAGWGWKVHHRVDDKYWFTRPGKDNGVSATWNHDGRKLFCVFSSSTDFATSNSDGSMKGHTPFSVYTMMEHGGDWKKATASLVAEGYVNPDEWEPLELSAPSVAQPFDLDDIIPEEASQLKDYVNQVAHTFQVQPEMVLLPAISAASLALCGAVRLKINDDWKEEAPIWTLVVAEASERKTPALDCVMKPFENYFDNFKKENNIELSKIKRTIRGAHAKLKKLNEDYDKACAKGDPTDELDMQIARQEQEIEQMPDVTELPNLIQSDITPEALVKQLERNGEVCGIISSEADPIEVALGLYSDKPNFSVYLKGFSVERYTHTRVSGGETVLRKPRLVMSVMMQREPMEKLATNRQARERGFLARCFYAVPRSKVGSRELEPRPLTEASREWWSQTLIGMLNLPHRLRFTDTDGELEFNGDTEPPLLEMSPEAYEALLKARQENEVALGPGGGLHSAEEGTGWGGKLMGNCCRLAMALHFISGKSISEPISASTMEAALRWVKPLTEHMFLATSSSRDDAVLRNVMSVLTKFNKHGIQNEILYNEALKMVRTRKMNKKEHWEPVFERMKKEGVIRVVKGERPAKGQAPLIMKLHPDWKALLG